MQCAKLLGQRDMLLKVFGLVFFFGKKSSCTAGTTDLALSQVIYDISISTLLKKEKDNKEACLCAELSSDWFGNINSFRV